MKKYLMYICLLIFLMPNLYAESGRTIMQNVIDNQKVSSSAMDIRMVLIDKNGGNSNRRIQTLVVDEDGLTKTITLFLEPASVKNTRFLTIQNESRDDDQWIYLPALRKVKRIAATEKDGSFMGSDFSYSDMSFSQDAVGDSTHTLLREETLNDVECYVVESIPKAPGDSSYGKQISWVDKETWLTARVEFYAKDKTTLDKVLTSEDFKQIEGRWIAGRVTMTTNLSGHKTVLEIKQVKYGIPINSAYFTTRFLETGRIR